jgi:hypothetical protein
VSDGWQQRGRVVVGALVVVLAAAGCGLVGSSARREPSDATPRIEVASGAVPAEIARRHSRPPIQPRLFARLRLDPPNEHLALYVAANGVAHLGESTIVAPAIFVASASNAGAVADPLFPVFTDYDLAIPHVLYAYQTRSYTNVLAAAVPARAETLHITFAGFDRGPRFSRDYRLRGPRWPGFPNERIFLLDEHSAEAEELVALRANHVLARTQVSGIERFN